MRKIFWLVLAAVLSAWGVARAADEAKPPDPVTPVNAAAIAEAAMPSLVRVEYTLQFDKSEPPRGGGRVSVEGETLIMAQRPLEVAGYVISPTQVVTADPVLHPRFIKLIAVRHGDQLVEAKPAAWARKQEALILELAAPLKDARPLTFNAEAKGPYLLVAYSLADALWTVHVTPMEGGAAVTETKRKYTTSPTEGIATDKTGAPVGLVMDEELPLGDAWKGSPAMWESVSAEEMTKRLAALEAAAKDGLPRVTLKFRSPKAVPGAGRRPAGEEEPTEANVVGVLTGPSTVLVLAHLMPKATARLEGILVHPARGEPVPATFQHTLNDYGAFTAKLQRPLEGAVRLSARSVLDYRPGLLLSADVDVYGEKITGYYWHTRLRSLALGWRRQVYPFVGGDAGSLFLFDDEGALAAMPISRRERIVEARPTDMPLLTAAEYLRPILADLPKYADASNAPLPEGQEGRLAWMGVELQPLDAELARANNVSDLTNDGQTGALVTYVYADSPASRADIAPGFILLRLHAEGIPRPVEVRLQEMRFEGAFPWEQLEEVSEQYFERIPSPWPLAENAFTRLLTDIGVGRKVTADFYQNGQELSKSFTVELGPINYDTAPRWKCGSLGITIRDMTYEVRRYFQKKPDAPGIIISRIEPGSKASVAGLKPYEILTHVNEEPIANVKDFEKYCERQDELRLSVERMTRGRIVKINVGGATAAPGVK